MVSNCKISNFIYNHVALKLMWFCLMVILLQEINLNQNLRNGANVRFPMNAEAAINVRLPMPMPFKSNNEKGFLDDWET